MTDLDPKSFGFEPSGALDDTRWEDPRDTYGGSTEYPDPDDLAMAYRHTTEPVGKLVANKMSYTIPVAREMLLDLGLIEPTPEEAEEMERKRVAYEKEYNSLRNRLARWVVAARNRLGLAIGCDLYHYGDMEF